MLVKPFGSKLRIISHDVASQHKSVVLDRVSG